MTPEAHRDLRVLEAIAEDGGITQRRLALHLGIALGLTNLSLQRLTREGLIRRVDGRSNGMRYRLTPKGTALKTRLTYELMEHSLTLYRRVRQQLRDRLQPIAARSPLRIAICGTGEAAEVAYLSLREMGLEPVAILDGRSGGRFLGLPVFDVGDYPLADIDVIIASTLAHDDEMILRLRGCGVPSERIMLLRSDVLNRTPGARPRRTVRSSR
jgi:DNA-binding MarR family transcriptional regulator